MKILDFVIKFFILTVLLSLCILFFDCKSEAEQKKTTYEKDKIRIQDSILMFNNIIANEIDSILYYSPTAESATTRLYEIRYERGFFVSKYPFHQPLNVPRRTLEK